MEPFAENLSTLLEAQGGNVASLTDEICLRAGLLEWHHRDPFDRIIAATSLVEGLRLVSADPVFDSLTPTLGWGSRIW
jgi:PIN domain nuclease of toxin-antitoxin system